MVVVEEVIAKGGKDTTGKIAAFLASKPSFDELSSNVLIFWEADGLSSARKPKPLKEHTGKRKQKLEDGLEVLLQAQPYTFSFPLLSEGEVRKWIEQRINQAGRTIEPAAVSELASIVESDLWRAANEADKLIAWQQRDTVRLSDVSHLVERFDVMPSSFEFLDAVGMRAAPLALSRLCELIQSGTEPVAIHAILVRLIRTVCLVKSYLEDEGIKSKGKAAEDLGLHPYVVKKIVLQSSRFSWDELFSLERRLLQVDRELKGGSDDPMLALEMFVIEICKNSK